MNAHAWGSAVLIAALGYGGHAHAQVSPSPCGVEDAACSTGGDAWLPRSDWVPPAHAGLLMTGMRVAEIWIWPEPFADFRLKSLGRSYERAYTLPPKWDGSRAWFEWDGDPWYVNAVGHALFGSEVYLRARLCRWTPLEAVLLSGAASTVWEYGIEASAVRPSALDLWYTPLSGALFGELRYWGWSSVSTVRSRPLRAVLRAVFDPFGELERAVGLPC